jgi:S-DNA-T family DNA segregation ATPase FtsK/SpoIIIE
MAIATGNSERRRLLPGAFEASIKRMLAGGAGATLFVLACAAWLSLATWSIHDPSLNHATREAPSNLLAQWGAVTADLSIQTLGLAAIMLFLPLAAWGRSVTFGQMPSQIKWRLVAWPVGTLVFAGGLSALPVPSSWPLPNGFGGIMGDLVLAAVILVLSPLPQFLEHAVAAVAFIVTGGAACLYAAGVSPETLEILRGDPKKRAAGEQTFLSRMLGRVVDAVHSLAERRAEDAWDDDEELGDEAHESYSSSSSSAEPVSYEYNPEIDQDDPLPRFLRREQQAASSRASGRIEPFFANGGPEPDNGANAGDDDDSPYRITRVEPKGSTNGATRSVRRAKGAMPVAFSPPPVRLLKKPPASRRDSQVSNQTLQQNSRLLEEVLADFGVNGEITNVSPGPVVTLYELEPAPGTKSSRVIGLADDIARSMSAISARVAVIPGRNAIGIELPNERRQMVYLRELLETNDFEHSEAQLSLALGKNIGGESVFVDLARMPHLLIAGTTGSGKSVGVNTMILSLLYRMTPEQCRFIMVDPKMLELSVYDGIPHLLAPVVTDPKKAVVALKWTVKEMEERYKRMSKLGVRNINSYNERVEEAQAKGEVLTRTVQTGFDKETGDAIYEQEEMDYEPMPYIVVIVDEMADLMMVAGKDIEGAIQRLAQMARAAGIHLITATQRPSVDVITGTIKANFPTRVSFQVTSKIDSRTILGEQGGEQLLGQGDMLYMAGGGRIMRVHGPFVSDEEVEKIVRYLKKQGIPEYLEAITEDEEEDAAIPGLDGSGDSGDRLYDQAVAIVLRDGKASTSYIQRRLSIGYNRAATLIERMEEEGVISAANHAGKREILVGENA